jgi:hypothetical protein
MFYSKSESSLMKVYQEQKTKLNKPWKLLNRILGVHVSVFLCVPWLIYLAGHGLKVQKIRKYYFDSIEE